MNYQDPELQSRLAAEYVLGTLQGRARKRFERILRGSRSARAHVTAWENRLKELNEMVDPVAPPTNTWQAIERRLFAEAESAQNVRQLGFWKFLGLSASALSIALALYIAVPLIKPEAPVEGATLVSILEDDQKQAIWTVQIDQTDSLLRVNSVEVPAIKPEQDYELWLLPPNDQAPISLGLLPQGGTAELPLSDLPYESAAGIAVSLEPAGGSTTGAPTGPVLYVAKLFKMG